PCRRTPSRSRRRARRQRGRRGRPAASPYLDDTVEARRTQRPALRGAFMGTTPAGMRGHLTLGRAFILMGLVVAVLLGVLLAVILRGWRVSVMDRARSLREEASRTIGTQVENELYQAQRVLEDVE